MSNVALVDLDNTVYPWTQAMAYLVAMAGLSTSHPEELIQLNKTWDVAGDWAIPEGGFNRVWEKAIEDGSMWGLHEGFNANPLPGSVKALWELSDRGWHIHLVTHRLNKFRLHDHAVRNTADWLEWAGIPYRGLTFTEDKHKIIGDVIIDDNPNNLVDHPAPIKILYPANHNEEFEAAGITTLTRDPNLRPWDEIVEILGTP